MEVGRARMQGHADPDRARLAPQLGSERALRGERGRHTLRCGVEGGAERVPDNLEDVAAGQLDRLVEQPVMADQGALHRLGMLLPEPRAALDVREEEGDRACGKRRHVYALALRAMRVTLSDRRFARACQRPGVTQGYRRGHGAGVLQGAALAPPTYRPRDASTPCCDKATRPVSPRPHPPGTRHGTVRRPRRRSGQCLRPMTLSESAPPLGRGQATGGKGPCRSRWGTEGMKPSLR